MSEFLSGRVAPIDDDELNVKANLGANLNPQNEAEFMRLSASSGLDTNILRSLSSVQFQALKNREALKAVPGDSGLREYFADPAAFAISEPDIGILNKIGSTIKDLPQSTTDMWTNIFLAPDIAKSGAKIGQLMTQTGMMSFEEMEGNQDAAFLEKFGRAKIEFKTETDVREALGYKDGVIPFIAGSTGETAGQIGTSLAEGDTGRFAATAVLGVGTLMAAAAVAPGALAVAGGAAIALPAATIALPPVGATLLSAGGYGAWVGMTKDAYKVEAGHAYMDYKELLDANGNALPKDIARVGAHVVGAINAGLEASLGAMAMKALGQFTPQGKAAAIAAKKATSAAVGKALLSETVQMQIRGVLANYAKGLTAETANEILQEVAPIIMGEVVKQQANERGTNVFPGVKGPIDAATTPEAYNSYFEVGLKTFAGAGGVGAPMAVIKATTGSMQAHRATKLMSVQDNVNKLVQSSATFKTSPEMAERAVKASGFNQTYVINPQDLIELKKKDADVLSNLGITEEDFQKSVTENVPMQVTGAGVAARLTTEQQTLVRPVLRGDIDGQTVTEAEAYDAATELKNATEVVNEINSDQSRFQTAMKPHFETLRTIATKKGWDNDYAANVLSSIESFAFRNAITEKTDIADFVSRLNIQDLTDQIELAGETPVGDEQTGAPKAAWQMTRAEFEAQRDDETKKLGHAVFDVAGVEVIQNPTSAESRQITKEVRERFPGNRDAAARFTEDAYGNRFLWAADKAVHAQIEPGITERIGRNVNQNANFEFSGASHRREVFYAMKEGKAVPTNVVAEYPEFMTKEYQQAASKRVLGRTTVTDNKYLVQLFADADMSTVLHELGHVFLSEMKYLAENNVASDRMKADIETLNKWFKSGENAQVSYQELFARGFEKYLRSGIAPSAELHSPFERYRTWLKAVYRTSKDLEAQAGFKINVRPEVAQVFDRMLATDNQITAAAMDVDVIMTEDSMKAAGFTEIQRKQMKTLMNAMKKNAAASLQYEKERSANIRENQWRKAAEKNISESRVFKLKDSLVAAPINLATLKQLIGESGAKDFRSKRAGMAVNPTKNRTPLDPEFVAHEAGYSSVDAMVVDILESPSKQEYIDNFVNEAREAYESQMEPAAQTLIDEEATSNYLEAIGKLVAKMAGQTKNHQASRALRIWADGQIGQQKVGVTLDANKKQIAGATTPGLYLQKFSAAMARHKEAFKKADYQTALQELNLARREMAKSQSAKVAKAETSSAINRMQKQAATNNKKTKNPVDVNLLLHLRQATNQIGITRMKDVPQPTKTVNEILVEKLGDPSEQVIPTMPPTMPEVLSDNLKRDYRTDMTLNEFRQVAAFTNWLYEYGKKIAEGKCSQLPGTLPEYVASLISHIAVRKDKGPKWHPDTFLRKVSDKAIRAFAAIQQMQVWFKSLDGYTTDAGIFTKLFFSEVGKATTRRDFNNLRIEKEMGPHVEHIVSRAKELPQSITNVSMGLRDEKGEAYDFPPIPKNLFNDGRTSWDYEEIMMFAMNQGTAYNKQAVLDGYGLTQPQVDQLLRVLNDKDLDAVQGIVNIINSQWPALSEAYERMNMIKPSKNKADTWTAPNGRVMEGGYFPIKFDPKLSFKADEREAYTDFMQDQDAAFFNPKVRSGFMNQRKGSGALPVHLKFSVILNHLNFTSHYAYMAPIIDDVNKITRDKNFQQIFIDKFGDAQYKLFLPYWQNIAAQGKGSFSNSDSFWSGIREKVNAKILGGKPLVGLKQPLSWVSFTTKFGPVKATKGFFNFMLNARANMQLAFDLSPKMRERFSSVVEYQQNSDMVSLNDLRKGVLSKALKTVQNAVFGFIYLGDAIVSLPIWHTAYVEATKVKGLVGEDAVQYADEWVSLTNPTTLPQDNAAVQRERNTIMSMFTLFKSGTLRHANNVIYNVQGFSEGKIPAAQFAQFIVMDMLIAPAASTLLVAALRGKEVEPKELLVDVISYQFTGIPLMGELVTFISRIAADQRNYGLFESPISEAFQDVEALLTSTGDDKTQGEEKQKKIAWNLARVLSFYAKVPATRMYEDLVEGIRQYEKTGRVSNIIAPNPDLK